MRSEVSNSKAREGRVKTGGPDLFEAMQHEENSSAAHDLEGKEVDAISPPADAFTHENLRGDDKKWNSISTAPAEQDLEVRLGKFVWLVCALISVQVSSWARLD